MTESEAAAERGKRGGVRGGGSGHKGDPRVSGTGPRGRGLAQQLVRSGRLPLLLALCVLFALVGCSFSFGDPDKTSTTTASTAPPEVTTTTKGEITARSITLQGLWVSHRSEGSVGGVNDMTVNVSPGTSGNIAVGVIEGEVFGTGAQWRVASWSAALAASNLLNVDLSKLKISYEVAGRIDGPSAGCLMTVGTLAGMLGDDVREDVTMTGTINPDYTVGPVGGIPHKLEGAAAAGKKIVLVPAGQRMDYDDNLQEWVDVVRVGADLGLEVIEVGDVFEAYEHFTDRSLPEPRVSARAPELSPAAHDVLLEQASSWIDYCNTNLDDYDALPDTAKSDYEEGRVEYSLEALGNADKYASQGLAAAALYSAIDAARQALLAVNYAEVEQFIQDNGEQAAVEELAYLGISDSIDGLADELLAVEPVNVSEAVALVEAWGYWTVAGRLSYEADDRLAGVPDDPGEVEGRLGAIYDAVWNYTLAMIARDSAYDALALGQVLKGEPIKGAERLGELAEVYRRVAEANLDTVHVLVVPGMASDWGVSEAEAYDTLITSDQNLAEAEAAVGDQQYLLEYLDPGPTRDYAVLGAALVGYAGSAAAIAEHYSYGAVYDEEGIITGYDMDKALHGALDFARTRGEKLISAASGGRSDTALPVMYYEAASIAREGYPGEKIDALYGYWTAAMYAQIMAALSGDLEPLAPR